MCGVASRRGGSTGDYNMKRWLAVVIFLLPFAVTAAQSGTNVLASVDTSTASVASAGPSATETDQAVPFSQEDPPGAPLDRFRIAKEVDLRDADWARSKSGGNGNGDKNGNGDEEEEDEENGDEEKDGDEEEKGGEGWDRSWDAPKLG
jgi:hypothetical protein